MLRKFSFKSSLILLFGFLFMSCGNGDENASEKEQSSALKSYKVAEINPSAVQTSFHYTGRVLSLNTIQIRSEVQGIILSENFRLKTGNDVSKGQIIARVEDTKFSYNLKAQKSRFIALLTRLMSDIKFDYPNDFPVWENYLERSDENKTIQELPEPSTSKLRFFLSSKGIYEQYYSIKSQEEALDDFTIRAPFDGFITSSSIDAGSYVTPQQPLGSLISSGTFEIETAVPLSDLQFLEIGTEVTIQERKSGVSATGTVSRIGKSISEQTQSVAVFIESPEEMLKSGMYVDIKTSAQTIDNAIEIPSYLITRTNQVYTVDQNNNVQLKAVTPSRYLNETVIVKGLNAGDRIIAEKVTRSLQGQKITVEETSL